MVEVSLFFLFSQSFRQETTLVCLQHLGLESESVRLVRRVNQMFSYYHNQDSRYLLYIINRRQHAVRSAKLQVQRIKKI